MWKVYWINGLPRWGLSGLTGTLRLKADLSLPLTWRAPALQGKKRSQSEAAFVLKKYLIDFFACYEWKQAEWSNICSGSDRCVPVRLRDPPEITAHARHLLVTQPTPECGARCVRACVRARHLTNTVALCTFELPYIVWSEAFISTLVNVSAGKVSSFDALPPPRPPQPPFDHSQVSPCCYDWSHSSVLPEISCANKHSSRESESSDERDTKEITRSWFLNLHQFGPGCAAAVLLQRPPVAIFRNNTLTPLY